ncbi:MAG: hypothetical protein RI885_1709 [Actinomycetota bacterium]|jgi:precorrin-6B methylase 2
MKKKELEKAIAELARSKSVDWIFIGGTKHDKFLFNGVVIMIPRHREIGEMLSRSILNDCKKAL